MKGIQAYILLKKGQAKGCEDMENFITIIHYIALGLSLAAPIGPMNIEVLKRGYTEGFLSSWLVGLGGLSGDILILLSIFFGLQDFMQNKLILYVMYLLGVVMLSYLGITSLKKAINKTFSEPECVQSNSSNSFFTGFTISLANPISLVFWFGVYGTSLQLLTTTHSIPFSILASFAIIAGLFLWNLNLVLTVYFSKKMMNVKVMRGITFIAGICLLFYSIQFLCRFIILTQ
jgi:threonine/homoserine/homoserine lactone efflux protein